MSDGVTYCDVVESCEECPRYGDDCDGDKKIETPTLTEKHQSSKGGDAKILNEDFRPKYMQPCPDNGADLISRQDALKPFCTAPDGTQIPEVDCDNYPVEFSVEFIKKHLLSLPSAEAVHKPDYSYEADMVRRLKELLSAEAEDRHYIKIYADDEPSVKAEKLYQISGEQNSEVAEWVKEYFPLAEAVQGWIPCSERLPSEDGRYLVCMSWEYDNMEVLRWADGWNCHRNYDGKISRESEIDGTDIIAWMPLPTPYKGGDDE